MLRTKPQRTVKSEMNTALMCWYVVINRRTGEVVYCKPGAAETTGTTPSPYLAGANRDWPPEYRTWVWARGAEHARVMAREEYARF